MIGPFNCVVFKSNVVESEIEEILRAIPLFQGVESIRTIDFTPVSGVDIKIFRHKNNLTQKQFCSKLRISPKTLGKWENEKSNPTIIESIGLKCIMNEIETGKLFAALVLRA